MTIQKVLRRIFSFLVLAGMFSGLAAPGWAQARLGAPQATTAFQPQTSYAVQHDLSQPLRTIKLAAPSTASGAFQVRPRLSLPKANHASPSLESLDPVLQNQPAQVNMPAPQFNFEGTGNLNSVFPPDPNGDIGGDYYVQWVNLSIAVWHLDRTTDTATRVYGPVSGSTIWSGFGGLCETTNQGDPIVLYDHLANRWLISQFAFTNTNQGPYYECIAISQTGDPTGAWYRYAFKTSDTIMNDYPHLGVWPDGYYMTTNQFDANDFWAGGGAWVFERDKILAGQPARQVYFNLYNVNQNFGGMLPSDLDGPPPPVGTPNYFAEVDDSTWIGPQDALRIWEFHVDWTNTANSTFGVLGNPNATLPVANFNPLCLSTRSCIPQPGTTVGLDAVADRLMHRLQYRNFGSYATLVANHTVNVSSTGSQAGVRWYELRQSSGAWSIQQQGTYSGDTPDAENRWMGSAAMDKHGDIAIGYSVSSSTVYPSIRYTGRLAGDPPNTLPQGEATLVSGSGSQLNTKSRWGDYSMLGVDPTDDCTFWYTQEYYQTTSSSGWQTRIGSFAFPTCLAGLMGNLQGTVTATGSGLPVAGAQVTAGGSNTLTSSSGAYQFQGLAEGTYTVTVSAYGYQPASSSGVIVTQNLTTTQDFALDSLPTVNVTGKVSDGSGQGWPLYARIDISSNGFAKTLFTDPVSGTYSIQLAQGVPHTFAVSAVSPGYLPQSLVITPTLPATTQNFSLLADTAACLAPGYANTGGCAPQNGGLVVGSVYDANTGSPVNGAVIAGSAITTTSFATPDDPNLGDGFYTLFASPSGTQTISTSALHYGTDAKSLQILSGQTISSDFHLPAGRLIPQPTGITLNATSQTVITRTISLSNTGTSPAAFSLSEVNAPVLVSETTTGKLTPSVWKDIPWLSVAPITGTLETGHAGTITLRFDPGAAGSSTNQAQLIVQNDTPYGPVAIPIVFTVKIETKTFLPFLSHNR